MMTARMCVVRPEFNSDAVTHSHMMCTILILVSSINFGHQLLSFSSPAVLAVKESSDVIRCHQEDVYAWLV